jgi:MFS family permease
VAGGVFLQAACWLPMALLALIALPTALALPAALLLFTLYFATGMIVNPIWATWMAEIVEPSERGRYFASRNQVAVFALLVSTILGGLVLLLFDRAHPHNTGEMNAILQTVWAAMPDFLHLSLMQAFALLFILAFLARTLSAWQITRMRDRTRSDDWSASRSNAGVSGMGAGGASAARSGVGGTSGAGAVGAGRSGAGGASGSASNAGGAGILVGRAGEKDANGSSNQVGHVDWWGFLTNPALDHERRFCFYTAALYGATYIASPFFDAYMLTSLHLDYLTWALISIAGPLARFLALPYWGRLSDRFGNRAILLLTGFMVPFTPLMWLFGTDATYLFLIQMVSGMAWSGLELAAFNYNINRREPSVRTAQTSAYSFAKGVGYLGGAIVGGTLLTIWPAAGLWGVSAFFGLYIISGIMRMLASLYFLPRFSARVFAGGMNSNEFFWEALLAQPGRELTQNMMQLSQTGLHLAQSGASATRRAARQGLDFTVYMIKRGPLLIRKKKDRL